MALQDLAFSPEEYRRRVRQVQALMAERDLDALLCHNFSNVCYLAGIESVLWYKYFLALIPCAGDPTLLAEDFEMPNAWIRSWVEDQVPYRVVVDDPIAATRQLLVERGLADKRLGIELHRWALSVPQYLRLQAALPHVTWVDATDLVEKVKVIKSPAEIALMRRAASLTSAGMRAAIDAVGAGRTDNDVAAAGYQTLIGGGSEYMSLDPIVTVGAWSGVPHSTHCRRVIEHGDAILLEMGACLHRYTAASMRSAVAGPPSDEIRAAADACIASLNAVIENLRPGAVAREVAAAADRAWPAISQRLVWHGIYAYSLGLGFPPDWNDCPVLVCRGATDILRPGMVFHVTTSLREKARYGVAFSETVLVTEDGCEVLTDVPRALAVR